MLLLSFTGKAFSQSSFESNLADAVSAQSAGNVSDAIAAYQHALAIRRDVPEVWANLGLMQHQVGDYAAALLSFKTANQLKPTLFVPVLFLGIENLQLGNREEAVHYLSMARKLQPDNAEIHMNLGRAYFGLKQFEDASLAYRRTTELDSKKGEAWYRLGITYLEMSEAASGELAKLNRRSPFFQRLDADSLADQDKLREALEVYRRLLANKEFPPCTRSAFGVALIRSGRSTEAQPEFQQDIKSGGCSLAQLGLSRMDLDNGDAEAALKSLAVLWTLDPGFVRAYAPVLTRGMTAEQVGAFDRALVQPGAGVLPAEATSVLQQSLRGGRTLSMGEGGTGNRTVKAAYPKTSQELYLRGEYGRCTKSLALPLSTLSTENLSLLAACSFFTGDYRTTLAAAKKLRVAPRAEEGGLYWTILAEQRLAVLALAYAVEVEPNSIRLHELLAESYRDRERYSEAEAEYNVALGIDPKDFAALIGAATNYLQVLKVDPAREMIQRALVENASDPEANYIMGEVLIAEHKYSDAEPYLRIGLAARAQLVPRIHALLGLIYATHGDTNRAIDEYKLGLPSDDDGAVHFQLGRLYQKAGEAGLAADAFAASKALIQQRQLAPNNVPNPH